MKTKKNIKTVLIALLLAGTVAGFGYGVWETFNRGKNWSQTKYPFWRPMGIVYDREDLNRFYVYSYGACIWKGTAQNDK